VEIVADEVAPTFAGQPVNQKNERKEAAATSGRRPRQAQNEPQSAPAGSGLDETL